MITANTTIDDVRKMKNKPPSEALGYYKVIDHKEVFRLMVKAIQSFGWSACTPSVGMTRDDKEMVATMMIKGAKTLGLWFGVVNSNTGRRLSRLFAGVEYKGATFCLREGDVFRHSIHSNASSDIKRGMKVLRQESDSFDEEVNVLRTTKLPPSEADSIVFEAPRHGLIAYKYLACVENARNAPFDKELTQNTALSLYHAFSRALKTCKPISANPRTDQLSQLHGFKELLVGGR